MVLNRQFPNQFIIAGIVSYGSLECDGKRFVLVLERLMIRKVNCLLFSRQRSLHASVGLQGLDSANSRQKHKILYCLDFLML